MVLDTPLSGIIKNLQMKTYNLFLDDFRVPLDAFHYMKDPIFTKLDWLIVRSYKEFTAFIEKKYSEGEFPQIVAFDHDLADDHYNHLSGEFPYENTSEKTGYHCAKWLIDFCIEKRIKFPLYTVHSMNPVGRKNIQSLIENYLVFEKTNS